jgi:hypothetical protein
VSVSVLTFIAFRRQHVCQGGGGKQSAEFECNGSRARQVDSVATTKESSTKEH